MTEFVVGSAYDLWFDEGAALNVVFRGTTSAGSLAFTGGGNPFEVEPDEIEEASLLTTGR